MILDFYTVTDDNRVVSKNLGALNVELSASVYDDCSIMNPRFLLAYYDVIVNSNYIHVPKWNRYYYIRDIVASAGNRCVITCKEDYLMSNKDGILNLDVYPIRGSYINREPYLSDSSIPQKVRRNCLTIGFPSSPFIETGGYSYVMTVVGGRKLS